MQVYFGEEYDNKRMAVSYQSELSDRELFEKENSTTPNGEKFIRYYIETKVYYTTAKVSSDCNDITFINLGTTNVTINDVLILPNQQFKISGNRNEIDTTIYDVQFATPINTGNYIIVVRKLYTA